MEPAAPSPHIVAVNLWWLLSVAAEALFTLLLLLATTPFPFPSPSLFLSPSPTSPSSSPRGHLPLLFVESALSCLDQSRAPASPPCFAYLISGSTGDTAMLCRCLLMLYHPRNCYINAQTPDSDRRELITFIAVHPVLAAARNVRVVEQVNLVSYRGPTMVTTTLHTAAAFLWAEGGDRGVEWDSFINLSASDYPLVT